MCVNYQRFSFPICEEIIANSFLFGSKRNKKQINEAVVELLFSELNKIQYF